MTQKPPTRRVSTPASKSKAPKDTQRVTNERPRRLEKYDETEVFNNKRTQYLGPGEYLVRLDTLRGFYNRKDAYTFVAELSVMEVLCDPNDCKHGEGEEASIVVTGNVGPSIYAQVTKRVLGGFLGVNPNEVTREDHDRLVEDPTEIIGKMAKVHAYNRETEAGKMVTVYDFEIPETE